MSSSRGVGSMPVARTPATLSILQKRPSPQPTSSALPKRPRAMRPSMTGSRTCWRPQSPRSPRSPMESIQACAECSQPLSMIRSYRNGFVETAMKNKRPSSNHFAHRLHVDLEGFEEFRGHDVEADRKLQLDQRARRQLRFDGIERGVGRPTKLHDLVDESERGALHVVEAIRRLPVLKRGVLLIGDADVLADLLVGADFVGRLTQDACACDGKLAQHRIEFAPAADRASEPAILPEIARRVRHHAKDVDVAILAHEFACAIVICGWVAVVDAGHESVSTS